MAISLNNYRWNINYLLIFQKDYKPGKKALEEAQRLITRTGFKLYEPEAEFALARLYLAEGNPEQAKPLAQSAYEKAKAMHYCLIETKALEVLEEISKNLLTNAY
ncbi:MAG: hypothetical protein AB1414_11410 [bacterium]